METFTSVLFVIILVFGVLQIILFFKIWGMTNNVAAIRRIMESGESGAGEEDETVTDAIAVGALVVRKSTGEQLKVTGVDENGKFVCAKAGIEIGSFSKDDLCTWRDWLHGIYS